MNNHTIVLPFLEIGVFKPCSYRDVAMDDVEFITKDICTINGSSGTTYFEPLYSTSKNLIGFRLICARFLHRGEKNVSMVRLLWRAFAADMQKARKGSPSRSTLTRLYIRGAVLLARHPEAWLVA